MAVIKNKLLIVVLVSAVAVSTLIGIHSSWVTLANAEVFQGSIAISSPSQNGTYHSSAVPLNVTMYTPDGVGVRQLNYSLDSQGDVSLSVQDMGGIPPGASVYAGNTMLSGLSNGVHEVFVHGETTEGIDFLSSAVFTVNYDKPVVSVQSPRNETYYATDVALNYTVNESTLGVEWVGYSLDGSEANVTLGGNTLLTNLSYGTHSLIVYANDTLGNIGSETVQFTVAPQPSPTPTPLPSPSPTPQPTASPSPTPTATPQSGFLGTSLPMEYGYAIVAAAVIAVVALAAFALTKRSSRPKAAEP